MSGNGKCKTLHEWPRIGKIPKPDVGGGPSETGIPLAIASLGSLAFLRSLWQQLAGRLQLPMNAQYADLGARVLLFISLISLNFLLNLQLLQVPNQQVAWARRSIYRCWRHKAPSKMERLKNSDMKYVGTYRHYWQPKKLSIADIFCFTWYFPVLWVAALLRLVISTWWALVRIWHSSKSLHAMGWFQHGRHWYIHIIEQ